VSAATKDPAGTRSAALRGGEAKITWQRTRAVARTVVQGAVVEGAVIENAVIENAVIGAALPSTRPMRSTR
jgi:hypothetical protein